MTDAFAALRRVPAAIGIVAIPCLLLLVWGIYLQSQVHINHDVGWIAHSAAWLLDGQRFGTDILDPNPPLAWFLMLPAVLAAKTGVIPELVAIQAWSWILTAMGLALSITILKPLLRGPVRLEAIGLVLASVAVTAILPIGNFGQRDVIAFVLMLPYLCLLLRHLTESPTTGRGIRIAVGLLAGIGMSLKPFLILVPVLAESLVLLQARNLRVLFRAETLTMAATVAAYLAAILMFARDYLDYALPLIRAVYWAYDDSGYLIRGRFREAIMPAVYAGAIALATFSFSRVHALLLAWIAGFSASYWLQGKGFPYHAYPILGMGCMLLAYAAIHALRAVWRSARITRTGLRLVIMAAVLLIAGPALQAPFAQAMQWYRSAERETGEWGRLRNAVIERLRSLGVGPDDYLYAFSTHPHPGFPTVNYLNTQWSGRTVTQFAVPALVRRNEIKDTQMLAAIDRAVALQVAIVVEDLERHPPTYVMVEQRQRRLGLGFRRFDDLAFYGRNPAFAELWKCYVEIEPVDQIRLFRRRSDCDAG